MAPRKAVRTTPWLTRAEVQHLLRTMHDRGNVRDIALAQLVLHTGLRVGELCALTWQDVELTPTQGSLRVQGSPSQRRGGRVTRARTVPLNAAARTALRLLGYEWHHGTTRPVCTGTRGPLTERGAELLMTKYARRARLPGLTLGTLRHTFCRHLVEAGADVASIAALAGHTTLESALPYFAPQRQNLVQLVEAIVDEA